MKKSLSRKARYHTLKDPVMKRYNGHNTEKISPTGPKIKMYKDYVEEACNKDPYFKFATSLKYSNWVKDEWTNRDINN